MSVLTSLMSYWPRRAPHLPPGQRQINAFPRFSDKPLKWAPPLAHPIVHVSILGEPAVELDLATWSSTSRVQRTHDFHCVTTWTHRDVSWGGFVLRELLDAAGVKTDDLPPFARAVAGDNVHAVFLTRDLLDESVLLALEHDGAPLSRRHGGSVRLISPKQYGYKNVKHLVKLDFCASQPESTTGKKEHLRARVELEERHSTLPNWLVRVPYRLVIIPTALASERSLRASP